KSDKSVLDLLLQILGEGRLTDAHGRLADFRNSIIILTSNLGMDQFGKMSLGFDREKTEFSTTEHFTSAVAKQLRPELLNRIDRIIPFCALSQKTLRRILDRELMLLKQRQGITACHATLVVDDEVKDELVRLGYNPLYGARPLRRTLEQQLLRPLAELLSTRSKEEPKHIRFSLIRGKITGKCEREGKKSDKPREAEEAEHEEELFADQGEVIRKAVQLRQHEDVVAMRAKVLEWAWGMARIENMNDYPEVMQQMKFEFEKRPGWQNMSWHHSNNIWTKLICCVNSLKIRR
ncbi:MAG: AAA family ATPase, partial [Thermoguttaceae bacterium]|nr:AAA family ATPase [Thermoguttaceae bacterium]